MNLETMTNMSLLMKERDDRRTDEQVKDDTKAMLVKVLESCGASLDGDYSFDQWVTMKENWQVEQLWGSVR